MTGAEVLRAAAGRPVQPTEKDVVFTQYLRPNGRQVIVWIERSGEVAALARRVVDAGYHFDAEELMTREVSFTCEPDVPGAEGEDGPVAHEVVPNGPEVLAAVDRLVAAAAANIFKGE